MFTDAQMEQGYRSEVQERALVVSLQMFSLILERGVFLLKAQLDSGKEPRLVVSEDLQVLLPAIKVLSSLPPPPFLHRPPFFSSLLSFPLQPPRSIRCLLERVLIAFVRRKSACKSISRV